MFSELLTSRQVLKGHVVLQDVQTKKDFPRVLVQSFGVSNEYSDRLWGAIKKMLWFQTAPVWKIA